jgi:thioredoxin 1
MSNAVAVTDADFEQQVEQAEKLTVVDFWATWCGPCRMIAPILDQLAADYKDQVKVTKLDVDANIKTATRFNVRSIPMLLFFKGGKVVDQIVGAVPRQTIEAKLKQHVACRTCDGGPSAVAPSESGAHIGLARRSRQPSPFLRDASRLHHRSPLSEPA